MIPGLILLLIVIHYEDTIYPGAYPVMQSALSKKLAMMGDVSNWQRRLAFVLG